MMLPNSNKKNGLVICQKSKVIFSAGGRKQLTRGGRGVVMTVNIVTDSLGDIPSEIAEELEIAVIPMPT